MRVDPVCDVLQVLSAARARAEGEGPAGTDHRSVLPVFALGEYEGALQHLVLAWKNAGAAHLAVPLARAIAPCARSVLEHAGDPGGGVRLMPVPSSLAARLRRGEDHTLELARALAPLIGAQLLPVRASPGSSQAGAASRARREREMRLRAARGEGRRVIIVDDVVTTGSTLRAMTAALEGAGHRVLGAAVIASARVPSSPASVFAPSASAGVL